VAHRENLAPEDVALVPVAFGIETSTVFSIFIERPGANLNNSWPGKSADRSTFVGRIPLAGCGRRLRREAPLSLEERPGTLRAANPDARRQRLALRPGAVPWLRRPGRPGRQPAKSPAPQPFVNLPLLRPVPLSTSVDEERLACRRPHPPRAAVRCPRRRSERPASGRFKDVQKF